jgi:hypothetical protein
MDGEYGGISRSGSDGAYTYSVKDGWAKRPVGYITVMSAARFANWLSNGKGSADTENGSYKISGDQVTVPNHAALARWWSCHTEQMAETLILMPALTRLVKHVPDLQ